VQVIALILAKNGLGYIVGGFFTNSSGHPAYEVNLVPKFKKVRITPKMSDAENNSKLLIC
jgi:hypothetical protein